MSEPRWRMSCALSIALLVSGCASVPLAQGRAHADSLVRERAPQVFVSASAQEVAAQQIALWLSAPLQLEDAQRIALLRNPQLAAHYARLGISAADAFEAGRLRNPSLGISWLLPMGDAAGSQVGASLMLPFTDLLLRSSRRRLAGTEFLVAQEKLAADALDVLAATQQAWFECVAANQRVAVRRSIADAAQLASDMAQRYREAGNLNALEHQLQRAEASQARIALQDAQMEQADARAALQKQLGLGAAQGDWAVPDVLPDLPDADLPAVQSLLARVLEQRLDVSAARRHVQALRDRRDAVRRYRYIADTHVGAEMEREPDARRLGPAVELALPVFHQGQGQVARADAQLAEAEAVLAELESGAQAELSRQLSRLSLARDQVRAYREGLIPEREAVVVRLTEQANFMLVDGFAVLTARQQEYAAYAGYVDALQKFWTARVQLLRATGSQRGLEESR